MEILLNDINEFSTALYMRHVHGGAVADMFDGDDLLGVDRSLSLAKRVEAAKKAVAKERAQFTLAAAGKAHLYGGGGRRSGGRGHGRGQQQQQQHQHH